MTALLGAGMLPYQFSIGIANDLVDADDDRTDKPWKPLAAATIPRRGAFGAFLTCVAGGILVTIPVGWEAWLIGVAGLGCGLTYDIWLKRTSLSWVPFSIAFPLVPVWVSVALDSWDAILWWVFPLGFALGFAIHLANQAPDVGAGETGLPGLLGEGWSRALAISLFVGVAAGTAAVRADALSASAVAVLIGFLAAAIGPFAHAFLGRDGLFGFLSLAGCVLAIVFLTGA